MEIVTLWRYEQTDAALSITTPTDFLPCSCLLERTTPENADTPSETFSMSQDTALYVLEPRGSFGVVSRQKPPA